MIFIILFIAKYLANNLLHKNSIYYPLIAIGSTLPFITLSSIIKGYFFGKEKVFPITLSNIIEQIARLLLTTTVVAKMMNHSFNSSSSLRLFLLILLVKGLLLLFFCFSYLKIRLLRKTSIGIINYLERFLVYLFLIRWLD